VADVKATTIAELDIEQFRGKDKLKAFVVVRVQRDLRMPFNNANKGTVGQARDDSSNCLVYKATSLAAEPMIAEIPVEGCSVSPN
jgi:hypothetical protein